MITIFDKNLEKNIPANIDPFQFFMSIQGDVFREVKNRKTSRFILGGQAYFIKKHLGVGWAEIIKNLFYFRLPILGAKSEYLAIRRLEEIGVQTYHAAAFGKAGLNPANQRSFLVTNELKDTASLEDVCKAWAKNKPSFQFKQSLIKNIAEITRMLHQHGINHRDYYVCHFLIAKSDIESNKDFLLYLIDLHRVQIRKEVPRRWLVKDLAGLYFSVMDVALTKRDIVRFCKNYFNKKTYRDVLAQNLALLAKVEVKAKKLYQKESTKK